MEESFPDKQTVEGYKLESGEVAICYPATCRVGDWM